MCFWLCCEVVGNLRSCLNDVCEARKIKPDHFKALQRGMGLSPVCVVSRGCLVGVVSLDGVLRLGRCGL